MKRVLLLAFVVALMLVPFIASAAPTTDTATGIVIFADGTKTTLNYTDTSGSSKATVTGETITTTVTSEYGFADMPAWSNQDITPTTLGTYEWVITNEGNDSDKYTITTRITFVGTAAYPSFDGTGWLVSTEGGLTTSYGTVLAALNKNAPRFKVSTTEPVAEDDKYYIRVIVYPSTLESLSPDGSHVVVTVEVLTPTTPVGTYEGANGVLYGGIGSDSDGNMVRIKTSRMTMNRTATVDAPTKYILNGGGTHDAVPGSVITYTIIVTNEGSEVAKYVLLVDKVPGSTEAFHTGMNGDVNGRVTITAGAPSGAGWAIYYTTEANPTITYEANGNGWISTTEGKLLPAAATYIKWQSSEVAANSKPVGTFKWGVMIK